LSGALLATRVRRLCQKLSRRLGASGRGV
jgi:hypothetical protein